MFCAGVNSDFRRREREGDGYTTYLVLCGAWGSLLTLSRCTLESGDFNPFQHKMEEAITCSSLQVTSKGTNHRVLVCLSCVIQLVLHQLVWSNALCCFHLGQQCLCPPGFRRATSAQNPPATISAPCWGFGQAIPSGMPRHCAHPNLPISCSFQPPSKLGVAGKDGTRNFPAFPAHPTLSSAPALHGRSSQWLSSAPKLAGEPAQ